MLGLHITSLYCSSLPVFLHCYFWYGKSINIQRHCGLELWCLAVDLISCQLFVSKERKGHCIVMARTEMTSS